MKSTWLYAPLTALLCLQVQLAGAAVSSMGSPAELKLIAQQAQAQDPNAQLLYGLAFLEGRYALQPDAAKAVYWLRRAAREDQSYAQLLLGKLYAEGKGVAEDPQHAVYWWNKAANADQAEAQYRLGKAWLDGFGVEPNSTRALHWLNLAAGNGSHDAEYLLGKMYQQGYRVAQDTDLAQSWLSRAADSGHSGALSLLAALDQVIDFTTQVYQQSAEVLQQKANAGDPHAQYELGLRYESGAYDVNRDDQQALHWLTLAADNGNIHAMAALAHIYARGELGVEPKPELAEQWRKRAHWH